MPRALTNRLRDHFDWALVLATLAIAIVGVVNLYSATVRVHTWAPVAQIYWLMIGAGVAAFVASIDYRHFERYGYVLYAGGIVLLLLVLVAGRTIRGSQRWLFLGGVGIQPSEIMKVLLVVALAKYFHDEPRHGGKSLRDLLVPAALAAVPVFFVLRQPNLGTALVLILVAVTILVLARLRLRSFFSLVAIGVGLAPVIWAYGLRDYQRERVLGFLNPTSDALGSGWHARQSMVAIGSGMWTGKGFLQSTQNQNAFLPDQNTDFPFPIWAEEHGFLGSVALLGLYLFLVLWAIRIASLAKDRFGVVCSIGIASILFWQVVVNMGMVTGMLPVAGVTLPLFSYGGSSMIATMMGIGLLLNISMRRYRFP